MLAEPYSSYELSGEADVYVVALPEVRTRAEPKDRPKVRRDAVGIVLSPASTTAARNGVLSEYDVRYVLINTRSADRALAPLRADPDAPGGLPQRRLGAVQAASLKRTRRWPPRSTTVISASTASGMNCVPEQRCSSAIAPSGDIARR